MIQIPKELAIRFVKAFGGMGKWRGVMQEMLDNITRQFAGEREKEGL